MQTSCEDRWEKLAGCRLVGQGCNYLASGPAVFDLGSTTRGRAPLHAKFAQNFIWPQGDHCAIAQQEVRTSAGCSVDGTGDGENISALIGGVIRGNQGSAALPGLHHHDGDREAADQPVAHRKMWRARRCAQWQFRDDGTVGADNLRFLRDSVKDNVDTFINAYLSVNPKSP